MDLMYLASTSGIHDGPSAGLVTAGDPEMSQTQLHSPGARNLAGMWPCALVTVTHKE